MTVRDAMSLHFRTGSRVTRGRASSEYCITVWDTISVYFRTGSRLTRGRASSEYCITVRDAISVHFRTGPRLTRGRGRSEYHITVRDTILVHFRTGPRLTRGRASSEYHMTVRAFLSQSDALNLVPRWFLLGDQLGISYHLVANCYCQLTNLTSCTHKFVLIPCMLTVLMCLIVHQCSEYALCSLLMFYITMLWTQ